MQVYLAQEPPERQFLLMTQICVALHGAPAHGDVTASRADSNGGSIPEKIT